MAALLGPVAIHAGLPLFPADVAAALASVPAPRLLVSTPVHLRALLASGQEFPPLVRVLSATAPLDPDLAADIEARLATEVIEIYGCSEVGSMAWRRPAADPAWRFFPDYRPEVSVSGVSLQVPHLPAPVPLPDRLEFHADGSFVLAGRDSDLVKVAGKRGSLAEITRQLLACPGVTDAVVFPAPEAAEARRLVALVTGTALDSAGLAARLRQVLDAALVPRPILVVPDLPRSATGKLPRADVLALYEHSKSRYQA
jgi:acyl-coenzyme A synthetase/AMP-(fatty) acid ligase